MAARPRDGTDELILRDWLDRRGFLGPPPCAPPGPGREGLPPEVEEDGVAVRSWSDLAEDRPASRRERERSGFLGDVCDVFSRVEERRGRVWDFLSDEGGLPSCGERVRWRS